jgi:hypothetical protein
MNAVVYSVHVDNGNLSNNYNFEQLKTSLNTLRKINKDIPVKAYISAPEAEDMHLLDDFRDNNLEFVLFNLEFDSRLTGGIYTRWTAHKWPNTLDALKRFKLDNVLYIDTDTFFQQDPSNLFEKYGNTNHIWGKPDVEKKWPERFGLNYLGMNDGQQMVSSKTLPFLEDLISERDNLVYKMQEKYKNIDDEMLHIAIQYIYGQYAVSEFLISINNSLKHFDDEDVLVIIDDKVFDSLNNKFNISLVHFCNTNMERFDPNAYKVYLENNLKNK